MATHQLAQGLASLGRHGDSMLMHVSPSEVEGLKAIGSMTGRKVSINPHTGMPEAFDFGDFFSSLLPTLAGVLLAPGTAGGSLVASGLGQTAAAAAPIVGGMATGALVAGAKGDDPLMGGLMGGLGGYGGGNLAKTFGSMGGANLATPAISSGQGVQLTANNLAAPNLTGLSGSQAASALDASVNNLSSTLTNPLGTGTGGAGINLANTTATSAPGINIGANALDLARPPSGLESIFSGMKTLASDPFGAGYDAFKQAGGSAFDLAAPIGMAGLAGAQEDLYPEPDMSMEEKRKAEENKYRDPRTGLLNLAQASPGLRLATGGTVGTTTSTISSGGIQDLYGTSDQTTGTQNLSQDGYGIGRLNALAAEGSRAKAADTFYAMGGPVSFADGGTTAGSAMPLAIPESQLRYMRGPSRIYRGVTSSPSYSSGTGGNLMSDYFSTWQRSFPGFAAPSLNNPRSYFGGPGSRIGGIRFLKGGMASFAEGGQNYLDGQGDGMSDSIPATIEGKQPARLADGEFVIPADVVSHIGNGSSKAGSKQLYAMLDRIRKARTGHTKQGKEIKPQKYMPA